MRSPKVSIHIVSWNSGDHLPDLLNSIFAQTVQDFSVRIVDNGSSDNLIKFVRANFPQVTVIKNVRNLGFAAAHNQGIRYAVDKWLGEDLTQKYILVTNPDIILQPNFLEEMISQAEEIPSAGSFGGKLLRAFGENMSDEVLREIHFSDEIDSTGLRADRKCWVSERGAGEKDEGTYETPQEVFGISGALALYRVAALQDVRIGDEFFDQDFFAYKEDVDLAWRLQRAGWKSWYIPSAVSHHHRGMFGKDKMSFLERIRNRRRKSKTRSLYSTRNHLYLLLKNLSFTHFFLRSLWVVPAEFARFVYVLIFETRNTSAYFQVLMNVPKMLKKRSRVFKTNKQKNKEIRKWFA